MGENDEHFSQKYSQMSKNEGENTQKCAFPTLTIMNVYELIRQNPTIRYEQMEDNLGVDRSTIQRSIACSYFASLKRLFLILFSHRLNRWDGFYWLLRKYLLRRDILQHLHLVYRYLIQFYQTL